MSSNNTSSAEFMGDVRCRCRYLAPLKMSWSYANPGKRYRACPRYGGNESYRYFEWMDYDASKRVAKVIRGLLKRANNYEKEIEKLNLYFFLVDVGSLAATSVVAVEIKFETVGIALSPPVA
ncbi:uncharacterized protein LOC116005826 [Ipomoea triloba]|uniref:uncharacterized protein LOC116005826 n=1 Tax=Ipomoea triloba TaxID=35885 RepID=UPI00125D7E71|nr:uncharacterized protein LOC116005826 [Ipomoea triloba]